jgi:hypothetical protein
MTSSLLGRIAVLCGRRYRTVFAATAAATLVCLALITRLHLETDVLALLPEEEPVVERFRSTLERFGNIEYLLLAVRIPEGAVPAPYQSYADRLAAELQAFPGIERVDYRLATVDELFEQFAEKAVLFLNDEDRQALEERVSNPGVVRRVQEIRRLLGTPQAGVLREILVLDPLGLAEILLPRLRSSQGQLAIDWQSGYYLSRDHRLLLLLVEPREPPQNVRFSEELAAAIEAKAAELAGEWSQIAAGGRGEEDPTVDAVLASDLPPPPVIAMGGSYLTSVDEARFIKRDMVINVVSSVVLVLGLFLLAFRRLGPLLYAVVPLLTGLLFTFAFAALTLGRLSTATSGTAALLIGLGIDFIIVSYGRFVEERRRGQDLEGALAAMASQAGRAVLVGAITTAATFFAFLVTDFRGLWEMGFLTGSGILFCLVAVVTLLPALLAWHERRHADQEQEPNFYLHSFGTGALLRLATGYPRAVLLGGGLLTAALLAAAFGLRFEEDMMAMRPRGNRGIEVAQEIGEKFGSGFNHMMLVVSAESEQEVLQRTAEAARAAQRLVEEGILYRVDSVASLIPPPERQAAVVQWLAREQGGALALERILATWRTAAVAEGMRVEPFARGLELFRRAISPREPVGLEDFGGSAETRRLLARYVQPVEGGYESVVYLFPPENRYRREPPPQAEELAERLGPQVYLTGNNTINQWVRVRIKRDAWIAGVLGFLLVAVLIYLDFRRLADTVGALVPLLIGIIWMLGIMVLLGLDLNFMNIFVTTMIIGIGVDYGLHMLHRYREVEHASREEVHRALGETGKAVVVAALSTLCGFGSMSLSHYPGLRTTGYVAILGALTTAFVSITLLPAWFTARRAARERRG